MHTRLSFFFALLFIMMSLCVKAESMIESITGKDVNQINYLKEHSISTGGWTSMGGTYSTDNPGNHNNLPITFNDRSGELQLNQLNLFLQKSINLGSNHWDFGGRMDFMYGSDSKFTQANGWDKNLINNNNPQQYDIAIPQAYLEVFAPFSKGVSAKIGHFYTIIGNEVVTAPNNFFYSHSYTMQYGEPFTHTGILVNYALNDAFTLNAGTVSGWDNFSENIANWNFLSGLSWTNDDSTDSVSWSVISGNSSNINNVTSNTNRTMYSLVLSHRITKKLQYSFQHDFGYQAQPNQNINNSYWYGINQYLFYDLTDKVSAGFRGEWFCDNNGSRLNIGTPGDYFELTTGVNWKLRNWFSLRPEIRYDWANSKINTYDNQTKNNQLMFAMDIILTF